MLLVGVGLVGVVGVGLDNHRKRCKRPSDVGVGLVVVLFDYIKCSIVDGTFDNQ